MSFENIFFHPIFQRNLILLKSVLLWTCYKTKHFSGRKGSSRRRRLRTPSGLDFVFVKTNNSMEGVLFISLIKNRIVSFDTFQNIRAIPSYMRKQVTFITWAPLEATFVHRTFFFKIVKNAFKNVQKYETRCFENN